MHFEACFFSIGCFSAHIVLVMSCLFFFIENNNHDQKKPITYVCIENKKKNKFMKTRKQFHKEIRNISLFFLVQYIRNGWKWSWYSFHEKGFFSFFRKKSLSFYASIHSNFNLLFFFNVELLNEHTNEEKKSTEYWLLFQKTCL